MPDCKCEVEYSEQQLLVVGTRAEEADRGLRGHTSWLALSFLPTLKNKCQMRNGKATNRIIAHFVLLGSNSGLIKGTTPPWLITTSPRSLFSLHGHINIISQCVVERELTPRRCEWRAVSVLVQYVASCYPGRRYQPTREFRRPNIPGRQQDRLVAHRKHGL